MQNVMKRLKAKKANKGFTMVELIIVIAIIAVLAAVLAPQYLRFVEESRVSTDMSTGTSIETAINVLLADGTVALPVDADTTDTDPATATVTWNTTTGAITFGGDGWPSDTTNTASENALYGLLNVDPTTSLSKLQASSTVAKSTAVTWTITVDGDDISVVAKPDFQTWAD